MVDLEGSRLGRAVQTDVIRHIIQNFGPGIQVGGGLRTADDIDQVLAAGADRAVLGTAAVRSPELVREVARAHPYRIVLAVDARDGYVATEGWAETSTVPAPELALRFEDAGAAAIIYTDIGRDGMLSGLNLEATVALARRSTVPVIASGGVGGPEDLRALRRVAAEATPGRIEGVIVGRALYDGRVDPAEAVRLLAG